MINIQRLQKVQGLSTIALQLLTAFVRIGNGCRESYPMMAYNTAFAALENDHAFEIANLSPADAVMAYSELLALGFILAHSPMESTIDPDLITELISIAYRDEFRELKKLEPQLS